jgi:hypothetical protein
MKTKHHHPNCFLKYPNLEDAQFAKDILLHRLTHDPTRNPLSTELPFPDIENGTQTRISQFQRRSVWSMEYD